MRSAWNILVFGLPTLPVRFKRQQYTAFRVATFLESHELVSCVRYPGLVSYPFRELAHRQMRHSYAITLAVSLGHTKTLIEMPGEMTHSAYGKSGPMHSERGIRLSIGLESPTDLIRDLGASLSRARPQ